MGHAIPLTVFAQSEKTAIIELRDAFLFVDSVMLDTVLQMTFYPHPGRHTQYAYLSSDKQKRWKKGRSLHRIILELNDVCIEGMHVDHKDGNGLNNRLSNLRVSTVQENNRNRRESPDTVSNVKGVHWHKPKWGEPSWRARIQIDGGKRLHLGLFKSKVDAAKAYNEAAIKYFGEFARLHNIEELSNESYS